MTIEKFKTLRPTLIQRDNIQSDTFYARDFAALMGVDPYVSAYDIWLKRKYGFVKAHNTNSYVKAGLSLESVIANEYYMENRKDQYSLVKGFEVIQECGDFKIGGIPDFILITKWIYGLSIKVKGLEIKTAQADWDELPLDYQMQCQIYMHITGIHEWDLAVLIRGHEYKEYQLKYDKDFVQTLLDRANEFYHKYILGDEEPYDPLCFQKTQNIQINAELDNLAELRNELKLAEKRLGAQIEDVETKIKAIIGENKGALGVRWKATYATQSRKSYDVDQICEDYSVDKDAYCKSSEFRVLRLSANKQG